MTRIELSEFHAESVSSPLSRNCNAPDPAKEAIIVDS